MHLDSRSEQGEAPAGRLNRHFRVLHQFIVNRTHTASTIHVDGADTVRIDAVDAARLD
ncbi:hypothetical protein [Nonomuraea rubra]|uniref:hypothetical protein n=1 Tax=Nonomuraea rubra TaxID=46180 RepID=UPI003401E281